LGVVKTWDSCWYVENNYAKWLHEDLQIKKYIKAEHYQAGISKIEIERTTKKVKINIHTARPGLIIGKRGENIDFLKKEVQKFTENEVYINVQQVRKIELNSQLVAENVAMQLERRVSFRRAMKKSLSNAIKLGAKGIKIGCAGRLGGAEMARREWYREGRVPLHTLRADIDYSYAEAKTTYGIIGVKVWIYKGDVLKDARRQARII